MAQPFFQRIVEERIREAQKAGAFDDLPGKGKPLELEDISSVPEELRLAYHLLKNAGLLPPEVELRKEIHTLWDLLRCVEEEGQRRAILKDINCRVIRLDLLRRRSSSVEGVRSYQGVEKPLFSDRSKRFQMRGAREIDERRRT